MFPNLNTATKIPKYTLALCKPDKTIIAFLPEAYRIVYSPKFMDISELSFIMPYRKEGGEDFPFNDNFENMLGDYLILLSRNSVDIGYFIITKPKNIANLGKNDKEVVCYSSEFIIGQKILRGYKRTSITIDSLLDEVLTLSPSWSINSIEASLLTKYRSFDVPETPLLSFLFDEVASTYNCVFTFNTINNTIDVNPLSEIGENKGLVIAKKNLLKSISEPFDFSEIITKLNVYGKNDLTINSVNITGQSYLLNYDYYRTSDYMSSGLLAAYDAYDAVVTAQSGTFSTYLVELGVLESDLATLESDLLTLQTELAVIRQNMNTAIKFDIALGETYAYWRAAEVAKKAEIASKESDIILKEAEITAKEADITALKLLVSVTANFTTAQREELDYFTKVDTFQNNNIGTGMESVLLTEAMIFHNKINQPRVKFEIDIVDFLKVLDHQVDWNKLVIGDLVNINYEEFGITYVAVRLVGYTHDYDANSLVLEFSNKNRYDDPYIELRSGNFDAYNAGIASKIERDSYNDYVNNDKDNILDFIGSPIDTADNPIEFGDGSYIDDAGQFMTDSSGASSQMRIVGDRLVITEDGWDTYHKLLDGRGLELISSGMNSRISIKSVSGIVIDKDISSSATASWSPVFYADTDGNLYLAGTLLIGSGSNVTLIDEYGMDTKFIKWFKNMCWNSSFEVYDSTTSTYAPSYWTGTGIATTGNSSFFGDRSLTLTTGIIAQQVTAAYVDPQWYNDVSSSTRVSFHKKGGSVKVSVLNVTSGNVPYELNWVTGTATLVTGTSVEYAYNANWEPESLTLSFSHGTATSINVRFENSDLDDVAYVDAVIIEPDYTGRRPSFYTDGLYSIAGVNGQSINVTGTVIQYIYVQPDEPATAVEKDVWIDTDDYSRYDKLDLTTTSTLLISDNEFITADGNFTITLHGGTSAGIIKQIYNIGSGLIKLDGTINGDSDGMYLYPNESVYLITDGTNWRI